eukprot:1948809-Rhodomonas_salina.1
MGLWETGGQIGAMATLGAQRQFVGNGLAVSLTDIHLLAHTRAPQADGTVSWVNPVSIHVEANETAVSFALKPRIQGQDSFPLVGFRYGFGVVVDDDDDGYHLDEDDEDDEDNDDHDGDDDADNEIMTTAIIECSLRW